MGFTLGTKFNEDTEWEFTVSQETIESVVSGDGVTESDIADYCFTALIDARCKAMVAESIRQTNDGLYPWALDYCSGYMSNSGSNPCKVTMNVDKLSSEAVTCYERNLLTYYGTINNVAGHYLVMDMKNIKKWCINFDTTPIYSSGSVQTSANFPGYSGGVYSYSESNKSRIVPYDPDSEAEDPITGDLRLVNVLTMNDSLWIGYLNPSANSKELLTNQYMVQQAWDTAYAAANTFNAGYPQYILQGLPTSFQGWSNFSDVEFPESTGQTEGFASYLECDDTVHSVIRVVGQYGNNQSSHQTVNIEQGNLVKTLKDVHMIEAWCGLLFIDHGILYKPLIENKVIIGFTSDMDRPSEWDDITNVTGNNISPTPPSPTPGEGDDFDDHAMGAGSQLSGIAQLWVLTRAQLIALHAAFANAPVNYDPMSSFISVMGVGVSVLRVVGDSMPWTLNPINIKMSNGETWHTGVEGHIVDKQVSAFNEVNIHIQRKYNNFLDYSPYATHEIFLPMCGWITLPDIAVDRTITVTYIPDIETLKVRAVVSVVDKDGYRCVIGEKDGVMGAEIPFTNIGHSLFLGNTVVQSADIAGEIVTGAIGAGFTKTNAQGGKFRPYEGFTVGMAGTLPGAIGNALVSGNVNRTHFTTGNGSRIGFGDGENIQIKSTYHRIDKPNNYDHTVGKVCNKTGKLSEFTGFTVCDNPHINFSATEREKEEIKQLLEQGVIL